MGRRGGAAMAVALWVLVTAIEAADPGVATPRRCLLSHYGSLDPRALAAVKALRDRYVSDAQTSPLGPPSPRVPRAPAAGPGVRRPWRSSALAPRRAARISGQDSEQQMLPAAAGASGSTDPASGPVPRGRPLQAGWTPPRAKWLPAQGQASRGAFSQRPRLARAARFRVQSAQPSGQARSTCRNPRRRSASGAWRGGPASRRPCPAGGGDAELEAAQLLVPPKEGSSAALGEAGKPSRGMGDGAGRGRGLANWRPLSPQSCARLRVVVRDLADAQAVLSRLPSPDRFPGTGPTLELLAAARRDVGACVSAARAPGPSGSPSSLCAPGLQPRPTRLAVCSAAAIRVVSVSPDPGFGLWLGGWRAEWPGHSLLRRLHGPRVPPAARAGPAGLVEEVPAATEETSPNTESCEWSRRWGS